MSETQGSIHAWIENRYSAFERSVGEIIQRRSLLLEQLDIKTPLGEALGKEVHLLLYEPMEAVMCGASEASSLGFFDIDDAPPWDTWVSYSEGTILSWVPNDFVSRAQAGIDANPVDCIRWLMVVVYSDCKLLRR